MLCIPSQDRKEATLLVLAASGDLLKFAHLQLSALSDRLQVHDQHRHDAQQLESITDVFRERWL